MTTADPDRPDRPVPPVRTIHHFAGSGGTVMSKALAAQPATVLLSEVTPFPGGVYFNRFDPVQQFLMGPMSGPHAEAFGSPDIQDLSEEIFADRLRWILERTDTANMNLVLRDHAHSDFIVRQGTRSTLRDVVRDRLQMPMRSIVTLRNPIDSYIPGLGRNWLAPLGKDTFNRYCKRMLRMLDLFEGCPVFLYEDFCVDPAGVTQQMCAALDLPFEAAFQDRLSQIKLTGDSGRSGDVIKPRPRKPLPEGLQDDINASPAFAELCARFWPDEPLLARSA